VATVLLGGQFALAAEHATAAAPQYPVPGFAIEVEVPPADFAGRLLDRLPPDVRTTRGQLRDALLKEYAAKSVLLRALFPELSDRQRLVMFAQLRVHGSFPTYAIRSMVPSTLDRLLLSHRGNCSDHAIRLAMALDSLGIQNAFIPILTKSLPGHVIVDAFDPTEKTGYLLDSNTNVYVRMPAARASFLNVWINLSPAERGAFFGHRGNFYLLPMHYDYVDPGPALGFKPGAVNLVDLNSTIPRRAQAWRNSLTDEFDQVLGWWKKSYPFQPPRPLPDLGHAFDLIGLVQFGAGSRGNVLDLWKAAGLTAGDPGRHVNKAPAPLED
jgi:hypothetical protein